MRRFSIGITLLAALALAACGGTKASGDGTCGGAADCDPGEVCINDVCRAVCRSDTDCTVSGEICSGDYCVIGTRDAQPEITAVDGNGAPNPTGDGDAPHYIGSGMTIQGQHLSGVDVELVGNEGTILLEVCEPGDTQIGVDLPDTLDGGTYTLRVVGQAGTCSTTLEVLRGNPGKDGDIGPSGPAGAPGVPCVSCVDSATVADGALETADLSASVYGGNGSADTVARSDHSHGLWAIKPANESRNGTARPDDANLTLPLEANATYAWEARLQLTIGANSDYAVSFGAPTFSDYTAEVWYTTVNVGSLTGADLLATPSTVFSVDHSNAGRVVAAFSGVIHTTAAGAFVVQWAQRIANGGADAVMLQGSSLKATRLD